MKEGWQNENPYELPYQHIHDLHAPARLPGHGDVNAVLSCHTVEVTSFKQTFSSLMAMVKNTLLLFHFWDYLSLLESELQSN